jgi:tetratricopeptide (TPR) repeat protein
MSWRVRAVFVSGTFRDMHEERDLLADRVFRVLEEQLAQHYTMLERVDLRVGVETRGLANDHAKQELVLKVCLEDVRRCRPFMIVLIGDRYGWVPPLDRARAAIEETGFRTTIEGKSVTALEIEFGLFGDPDQHTRSRIYIRDLDYTGMTEADAVAYSDERAAASALVPPDERAKAADRAAALAASKQKLKNDPVLGPRCRNYSASWDRTLRKVTGLGGFVARVVEDFLPEMIAEADEQVAAAKTGTRPTPLEQFVAERSRGFRGRATIVARLCAFATGPVDPETPRGHVVAGASGSGKSATFARVFEELAGAADGDCWLLAHAAGIDPRSSSVASLLEDWVAILAGKLAIENPLLSPPGDPDTRGSLAAHGADGRPKPQDVFADLLARAAAKHRVVLLLDALDRFERTTQAEHLTWLPSRLPADVRLIATAVNGIETETLAKRPDFTVEPLAALTAEEASDIAGSVYARYHRQPNQEAVRELVEKLGPDGAPAHGNALWLVSALEELNLLDGDDFRRAEADTQKRDEDRLHAMVVSEARAIPGDIEELYGRVFDRAGRRVSEDPSKGTILARSFTVAIALSRGGFRERDLAVLIPGVARLLDPSAPPIEWNALVFAALRRALRAHVVRRGDDDRWDFQHRLARSAAERAYVPDAGILKQIHELAADHLLSLPPDDPLRESETMYHLIQADAREKAARLYAGEQTPGGLAGCTETLAQHALVERGLAWVIGLLDVEALGPGVLGALGEQFVFSLSGGLENAAPLDVRRLLFQATGRMFKELAAADPDNAGWQRDLAVSHIRFGDVLTAQGNLSGALAAFQASHAIAERLAAADPSNAASQDDFAVSHSRLGDVLRAQGNLPGALAAFQASHAIHERLAAADPGDAGWQRDLVVSRSSLGDVLKAQGNLPGALAAFQASHAIAERLAEAAPDDAGQQRDLAVSHNKLGDVLTAQGKLPGALAAFQASHAIAERLVAADPDNVGWQCVLAATHISLGEVLRAQGNLPGALAAFQAGRAIAQRLAAADPSNSGWQSDVALSHERLGNVLRAQGNLLGALAAFQASHAIRQRLAEAAPDNADCQSDLAATHIRLGDVLKAQGNLPGALAAFQAGRAIAERLAAADPSNAGSQRDLAVSHFRLGDVLTAQGNLPDALAAFQTGHAIAERLAAADPGWQRDLAVSHSRLGDVLTAQGNLPGALAAFQAGHAIAERLADVLTAQGNLPGALAALHTSHAIAERLAAADPDNASWQHDLSVSHNNLGDLLRAQGNLAGALAAFQAGRAIAERLADAAPDNAGWQRDLAISHERLGDALRAQGNLLGALAAFQANHAIRRRLAEAAPDNAGWQRDLAVSHIRFGDVLTAQGNLPGALAAFQTGRAIVERLAAADPGNAGWQRELAVSHNRLGDVLMAQGNLPGALAAFQAGRAIVERLAAADPGNAGWQRDLTVSHNRLGDVLTAQGNLPGALAAFQASHAIRQQLAAADPDNAGWQRDLAVSHTKFGDMLAAQGNLPGALAAFQAGRAIAERLAAADPGNAGWQSDLVVSNHRVASVLTHAQDPAAATYLRRCRDVLRRMKENDMSLDPPLERLLEQLNGAF